MSNKDETKPNVFHLERVERVSQAEAIARLLLNPGAYAQREDDADEEWLFSETLQRDDGTEYVGVLDQDGSLVTLELGEEQYWYIMKPLTELEALERQMQKLKQRIQEIKRKQSL